jgi:hypothetical protein
MNKQKKLEEFASREIANLASKLIVDDGHGGIIAFGKYSIIPTDHKFRVEIKNQNINIVFGSRRSAISWCIADQHNQHNLARHIYTLDTKKHSLAADIHCRQTLARRSNREDFYECVSTKIQSKIDYLSALDAELEKCLNSAKYMEIRGFSNETARTGRSVAHKTNR